MAWKLSLTLGCAALLLYLIAWPVPIDPVAWTPDPDPGHTGPFAPNHQLAAVQVLPLPGHRGTEHVAVGPDGRLYTGTESGSILRIDFEAGAIEEWVATGGRPLGLEFDGAGRLIVADAHRGLLTIDAEGEVRELASTVDGKPIQFANELAIAPDGRIYFTESSQRFSPAEWGGTYPASFLDLLEHRGTGRLLVYDPALGSASVLLEGLAFANGVAVSRDGRFVLVAETAAYRIWRMTRLGPDSGTVRIVVRGLPGFPDNLTTGADGRIWVALAAPRNALVDALAGVPVLRKIVLRLPAFLRPGPDPHAHVLAIDPTGRLLEDLQDPEATYPNITGVTPASDDLYLGSVRASSIARAPLTSSAPPDP